MSLWAGGRWINGSRDPSCILHLNNTRAKNKVGALLPQTVGLEGYNSNAHRINKIENETK